MTSVKEIQEAVQSTGRVRVRGGGSKPALSGHTDEVLDLSALQGVLEYQPHEYTFTARAGTPISAVAEMLGKQGQYLPFDPPLAAQGATLGGTVAAGLSGPGRYRYGGVRDFLIGIHFINGQGQEVRGGGAVVKNAAGFDFPKLFVGSLGRLGILTDLTFKVFPQPPAYATVAAQFRTLNDLLAALQAITRSPLDLQAVDFAPLDKGWTLWIRLGGLASTLQQRGQALQAHCCESVKDPPQSTLLVGQDDDQLWQQARSMAWLPHGMGLVKVPITPKRIPAIEKALTPHQVMRRYSVGGNLLWLGWPGHPSLHKLLMALNLRGIQITGNSTSPHGPLLGKPLQNAFLQRIAAALDPAGKFDTEIIRTQFT